MEQIGGTALLIVLTGGIVLLVIVTIGAFSEEIIDIIRALRNDK